MSIHPIQRTQKIYQWLKAPPINPNPRGTTILMWLMIAGTCVLVIRADADDDEKARHEAVCVVRLALSDFYDFIEEVRGPSIELSQLRMRLDNILPDEDCVRTIQNAS